MYSNSVHYAVAIKMSTKELDRAISRDRDAGKFGDRFHAYQAVLRERFAVEHFRAAYAARGV